ncbi:hypothetical protein SPBR_08241 [Sporothrix brasiliensis 5110]|uniref:Thioredoxin domain-containing protein n=1 Tax=Sporothrix brasiliensis 5110 TaxID=1398154 RepID=A0A0C2F6Z8_9PEZI|nr:uncharacterized protein SPBR_08241 [Sporothrix brasiliensis 5110]KIH86818.1 hypothetical protein SPBR_08241 [Sporothrix brasiliensis 5110]
MHRTTWSLGTFVDCDVRTLSRTTRPLAFSLSATADWANVSCAASVKWAHSSGVTNPARESCKRLDTEWTLVVREATAATVVSIDCTQDIRLCDELHVSSYPAIRLFHRDPSRGVQRYRGAREAPDLLAFLRRSARPILSVVDDANVTALLGDDEVVFVARYGKDASREDDTLPSRFSQLAHTYADRHTFAVSTEVEASSPSSSSSSSSLTCYRSHGEITKMAADLAASTTALDAFLELCTAPLVVDLTRRNELHYLGQGKSLVHYLYASVHERREYTKTIQSLAKTYGEYLAFTTVDLGEYGDEMATALGLQASVAHKSGPLLAVQNPSNGDVFPFPPTGSSTGGAGTGGGGLPSAAVVERFLLDIIQGAIPPWTPGERRATHDEL